MIVLGTVAWLAVSGSRDPGSKSYYVTIAELQQMGPRAHGINLRVAGNVQPGSITRMGAQARFTLLEQGKTLRVSYDGSEPPPDTFKDDAQALAVGRFADDGTFHASQIQAKCASKYAPAQPGSAPTGNTAPVKTTASL